MLQDNLIRIYQNSFREHRELPALTDYFKKETFSYYEMAKEIAKLHMLFGKAGIKHGERIALVGRNNPRWVITFVAAITYGAVIVPILHEFNANDINHIISDTESKLLFLSDDQWELIDEPRLKSVKAAFSLTDFDCIYERYGSSLTDFRKNILSHYRARYPRGFTVNDIIYPDTDNDAVASISYTAGTTGFSKGVMLTVNNLTGNVLFALEHKFHFRNSHVLCFLPLAHSYGCAFDMLTALAAGSHITLMGRIPSPKVLVQAMQEVKPNLICTIPGMMERVVQREIFPLLDRKVLRLAAKLPVADAVIRKKLINSFGGEITEVNMGGAPLNREVAEFLRQVKFPFTVGYGMTECGPLISYSPHEEYKTGSCGKVVDGMEARIDSADPRTLPGEILVRGKHVMKGYWNDKSATAEAFDADGWMHTSDMGTMDADGTLYVRGRKESMISLPGGTVFPEEIESRLNIMPCVMESLVTERDGRLVALVVPDYRQADAEGITVAGLQAVMKENLSTLNTLVEPFEAVSEIRLYPDEFEKTPKKSIKRYIYTGQGIPG